MRMKIDSPPVEGMAEGQGWVSSREYFPDMELTHARIACIPRRPSLPWRRLLGRAAVSIVVGFPPALLRSFIMTDSNSIQHCHPLRTQPASEGSSLLNGGDSLQDSNTGSCREKYQREEARNFPGFFSRTTFTMFFLLLLAPFATAKKLPARPIIESLKSETDRITRQAIEAEMNSRARRQLSRDWLVVDYYRIGRKLAFPLALKQIEIPKLEVPGIPDYPWEIWLSWELEERLNCLGWQAEWSKDPEATQAVIKELEALAQWPEFTPNRRLDLCLGHTSRVMVQACTRWHFVPPEVIITLRKGLERLVDQALPWAENRYGSLPTLENLPRNPEASREVHNIPFIGLIGTALAAGVVRPQVAPRLNGMVERLLELLMTLRKNGYSEGVGYDGYLLDFLACWFETLPTKQKEQLLHRYDYSGFLEESLNLAAPGDLVQVAEIADVEPVQMPFHLSAQARLQQLQPDLRRAWYLNHCPIRNWRADGLAALHGLLPDRLRQMEPPPAGVLDARYAQVLRSGWKISDLAVAIASSNSPAGHIHNDYGSITIGTAGRWLLADPGYQQYMPGLEREFTLGPTAHNTPVLNGLAQSEKAGRILEAKQIDQDTFRLQIDLAKCYPRELELRKLIRTVWLWGNRAVVVADQLEGSAIRQAGYSWHGHPAAAWRVEGNRALLYCEPAALWISSPSFAMSDNSLDRLPGSRGQMSLQIQGPTRPIVWWVFSRGEKPPDLELISKGLMLVVNQRQFEIEPR
jgi:hypothetical protein